jgi:YD repeat-containing protein
VGTLSAAELSTLSSAALRTRGTPLAETQQAAFGHPTQSWMTQQAGVVGTTTTEVALSGTELITRVHSPGGYTAHSAQDAAGNLIRKTDENGVSHHYGYDALGRIVHIETPDGAHSVTFDGFGRPASVTRAGLGQIVYRYDATTGLLALKQLLDPSGAVVQANTIAYDSIGRPRQVIETAAQHRDTLTFDYDGQAGTPEHQGS